MNTKEIGLEPIYEGGDEAAEVSGSERAELSGERESQTAAPREAQVIRLAAEGKTDKQIAQELGISVDTVATYWKRILPRFGASSRTEVIAKVLRSEAKAAIEALEREKGELRDEILRRKIAERELAETSERLEALIAHIDSGVIFESVQRRVIVANEAFCRIFSLPYSADELRNRETAEFLANVLSILKNPAEALEHADRIRSGDVNECSYRLELTDGRVLARDFAPVYVDGERWGNLWKYRDITVSALQDREIELQRELSDLVAEMAPRMIRASAEDIDVMIDEALASAGNLLGVDRSYVFLFSEGGSLMGNTHEWCAKGISAERDNLQGIPTSSMPWWMDCLNRGETIYVSELDDLPEDAHALKEILCEQGIQSLISVGLSSSNDGALMGFIGFDAVRGRRLWDKRSIQLLTYLGDMISAALSRIPSSRPR